MIKPQTLKGFRDFLPAQAIQRQELIATIRAVFELFGFDPLETPALEYAETLLGKYGSDADKLLYLFKDNGDRNVGLRYDQTVPFSRVIAQYPDLPLPFKRYQIQPVWRAENTQKGRYREFLQCDIDTVGTDAALADAEILLCVLTVAKRLGLPQPVMQINDRTIFDAYGLTNTELIILDKLDKIGRQAVIADLEKNGRKNAEELLATVATGSLSPRLTAIFAALESSGFRRDVDFRFDPFLARGLDYYTSTIFELKVPAYTGGSLAGGGRYDKLIGQFSGRDLPAVGVAFGFDRIVDAMTELHLTRTVSTKTQILVTIFAPEFLPQSLTLAAALRHDGIATEVYLQPDAKLEKQLKYADKKNIPYVIIQGPEEIAGNMVKLKDMQQNSQEVIAPEAIIRRFSSGS